MSMPYPVDTVAISENVPFGCEIALMSASILDGNYRFVTPSSSQTQCRKEFLEYCASISWTAYRMLERLKSPFSINPVNPEHVHLWIALDEDGEKLAKSIYEKTGDFSNKGVLGFPRRVVRCEFILPDISNPNNFRQLHELLTEQLIPWKDRIYKVMCDYS